MKVRFTEEQIIKILKEHEGGKKAADIVRVNMSAAFYTRRRQCFTVAAEKFDTCGGGI